MSRSDRANPSRWSRFDERAPGAGRVRAWVFLTHPGPSLLVTGVLVGATWLLLRHVPDARTFTGLVLAMLPAQMGIGALNDWADHELDARDKPHKPIVRGAVPRRAALLLAASLFGLSLLAAALLLGVRTLTLDAVAIAAGSSYDLGLKRTPYAVLAWWAGFATLPLFAMVVAGGPRGAAASVPLAGLLALTLLLANGLPDIEGDSAAGARTLPAALGARRSRLALCASLLAAAALAAASTATAGLGWGALLAGALLAAGSAAALLGSRAERALFPLLAILVAAASISWLAALPR